MSLSFQVVIRGSNGHELDRGDIHTYSVDDHNSAIIVRNALSDIMSNHIFMIGDSITIEEVE